MFWIFAVMSNRQSHICQTYSNMNYCAKTDSINDNISSMHQKLTQIQDFFPQCQECRGVKKFICVQRNCKFQRNLLCFICENKCYSAHFLHSKIQMVTLLNCLGRQIFIQNEILMQKITELKFLQNDAQITFSNSESIAFILIAIQNVINVYENVMQTNDLIQSISNGQYLKDKSVWDRRLLKWVKGLKLLNVKYQRMEELNQLRNLQIKQKIWSFVDFIHMEKMINGFEPFQKFVDFDISNKNSNLDSRSINIVKNHFTIPCKISRIRVNNLNISYKLFTKQSLETVTEFQIKTCHNIHNIFSRNLRVLKITYSNSKLTIFKELPTNLRKISITHLKNQNLNRRTFSHESKFNEDEKLYDFQNLQTLTDLEIDDNRLHLKDIKQILYIAIKHKYRNLKINQMPSLGKSNLTFKKFLVQVHKMQKSLISRSYGLIRTEVLGLLN